MLRGLSGLAGPVIFVGPTVVRLMVVFVVTTSATPSLLFFERASVDRPSAGREACT
jgi:hypothetical protein